MAMTSDLRFNHSDLTITITVRFYMYTLRLIVFVLEIILCFTLYFVSHCLNTVLMEIELERV